MNIIYDIITAGSATVDVFVKTHVSRIRANKKHEDLIAYPLGEKILVEDLHQEIGGGGTNTAVAFSRMGFKTAYFGALAKDNNSDLIISTLKKDNIDFIGVFKKGITNYSVILDSQFEDRTILAYKGVSEKLTKSDVKSFNARWLYMSSLDFGVMEKLVFEAKKSSANIAFNPSSYSVKYGLKKLRKVLQYVDVIIFNKEEAKLLLKSKDDIIHLLKKLSKYIDIPVITDSKRGAWVLKDNIVYFACPKTNLKVVETTGAGDAFASGFVSGMMLMKPIEDCLKLGLLNSESVITHLGAKNVLLDRNHALKMLKKDNRVVHKVIFK